MISREFAAQLRKHRAGHMEAARFARQSAADAAHCIMRDCWLRNMRRHVEAARIMHRALVRP